MEKDALCEKVLIACRTELCQSYPALNTAFASLPYRITDQEGFGTDGSFFYAGTSLIPLYAKAPKALRRGYLHTLIHCLFLHIAVPDKVDPRLWGIACDIWTERFLESLGDLRLSEENREKQAVFSRIDRNAGPHRILKMLEDGVFQKSAEELQNCFFFDDHSLWLPNLPEETKKKWEGLKGSEDLGKGNRGARTESESLEPVVLPPASYDFRRYLRQFTVSREEIETDSESFDYIPYTFGMDTYGNLPFIEPLEYKEVWRLDELVIAIDTSGSCSRDLVGRFLKETFAILSSRENFFREMKVVFFQCDCFLQDTAVIEDPESFLGYGGKIKIKGRGGTDFRPVFREVSRMRASGMLKKPRALLYFTDGDGVYPDPTDYETVFVLAGPKKQPKLVPKWAKKLILE